MVTLRQPFSGQGPPGCRADSHAAAQKALPCLPCKPPNTKTRCHIPLVQAHPAKILDTRKTVPGLRLLDKWAVLIGGGANHRLGLYDMLMIKDNHIAAAGGITAAVHRAQVRLMVLRV